MRLCVCENWQEELCRKPCAAIPLNIELSNNTLRRRRFSLVRFSQHLIDGVVGNRNGDATFTVFPVDTYGIEWLFFDIDVTRHFDEIARVYTFFVCAVRAAIFEHSYFHIFSESSV